MLLPHQELCTTCGHERARHTGCGPGHHASEGHDECCDEDMADGTPCSCIVFCGVLLDLEPVEPEEEPDPNHGGFWKKDTLAVIAADKDGSGLVLHTIGPVLKYEIANNSKAVEDMGLKPPPGISIWQGHCEVHRDPEGSYDSELKGTFRPPTEEEWEFIKKNECPWKTQPE